MMRVYEHKDPFCPPLHHLPSCTRRSVSSYSLDWHLPLPVANLSVAAVTSGASAQPGTTEHREFLFDTRMSVLAPATLYHWVSAAHNREENFPFIS